MIPEPSEQGKLLFSSADSSSTPKFPSPNAMEARPCRFPLAFSLVVSLGIFSFASCIVAEFKRTKKTDLRLNGNLCFLPESRAFGFGVTALICLIAAQMVGNWIICSQLCITKKRKSCCRAKISPIEIALAAVSWISFLAAVMMVAGGTSMSRRQEYGKGWLEGECYVVKGGVFGGSAILVLVSVSSAVFVGSAAIRNRTQHLNLISDSASTHDCHH